MCKRIYDKLHRAPIKDSCCNVLTEFDADASDLNCVENLEKSVGVAPWCRRSCKLRRGTAPLAAEIKVTGTERFSPLAVWSGAEVVRDPASFLDHLLRARAQRQSLGPIDELSSHLSGHSRTALVFFSFSFPSLSLFLSLSLSFLRARKRERSQWRKGETRLWQSVRITLESGRCIQRRGVVVIAPPLTSLYQPLGRCCRCAESTSSRRKATVAENRLSDLVRSFLRSSAYFSSCHRRWFPSLRQQRFFPPFFFCVFVFDVFVRSPRLAHHGR